MFEHALDFMKISESKSSKNSRSVIVCFVMHNDELLLLERSAQVELYNSWWNVLTGYHDGRSSAEQRVKEKLWEELGITSDVVKSVRVGQAYCSRHFVIEKDWTMLPVLVELKEKPAIRLSGQHQSYRWVKLDDMKDYTIVPGIMDGFEQLKGVVA
ncbi:MAG TPA: NUDIX domain-containing protein [Candidatus Nanoarchaeia archaeon]|nr:NUDIX domain-containing protein [Candidatus Nanoarchaeia archaeon]